MICNLNYIIYIEVLLTLYTQQAEYDPILMTLKQIHFHKTFLQNYYQIHGKDSQLSNESLKFSILKASFIGVLWQ